MRLASLDDVRHDLEVPQARVRRGADDDLGDLRAGHLTDRPHPAGARGQRDQRLQPGEVDLLLDVILSVVVGEDLHPVVLAPLRGKEAADLDVGWEDRRRRAQLGAHVGDNVAVHRAQVLQAGTVVLNDAPVAAVDVVAAQHLEDDVLGAHPGGQLAHQPHAPDLRHRHVVRLSGHAHGDIEPAGADRQHAERAGRTGVRPSPAASCPARRSAACAPGARRRCRAWRSRCPTSGTPSEGTGDRRRCESRPAAGCGPRTARRAPCARVEPEQLELEHHHGPVASWVSVWSMRSAISRPGVVSPPSRCVSINCARRCGPCPTSEVYRNGFASLSGLTVVLALAVERFALHPTPHHRHLRSGRRARQLTSGRTRGIRSTTLSSVGQGSTKPPASSPTDVPIEVKKALGDSHRFAAAVDRGGHAGDEPLGPSGFLGPHPTCAPGGLTWTGCVWAGLAFLPGLRNDPLVLTWSPRRRTDAPSRAGSAQHRRPPSSRPRSEPAGGAIRVAFPTWPLQTPASVPPRTSVLRPSPSPD
jgi:hypothetical protein